MNSGKFTPPISDEPEKQPLNSQEKPLLNDEKSDTVNSNTTATLESNSGNCSDIELDDIDSKNTIRN